MGTLPFKRLACSCRTITGDFERFHFFNLETVLEKLKLFLKNCVPLFSSNYYNWKCNISIQNCAVKKPRLRQIEWRL